MPISSIQKRRDQKLHEATALGDALLVANALAEGASPVSFDEHGLSLARRRHAPRAAFGL